MRTNILSTWRRYSFLYQVTTLFQATIHRRAIAVIGCSLCLSWMATSWADSPNKAFDGPQPFDGVSLKGWERPDGADPTEAWEVVDGVIHLRKERHLPRGGNLISKQEFGDFVLEFDFKNARKGNNGIKYRVNKFGDRWLGFEYQIYDDVEAKTVPPRGRTAAIYDLYEPKATRTLHPTGQWNRAKIVTSGKRLEHWLNGELITEGTIGDAEWERRYQESKFNEEDGFGQHSAGRLMLTDHGSEVWLRIISFEVGQPGAVEAP